MADKEMYDYLSVVTPDYSATTLSVSPQKIVPETGQKNQILNVGDDGSEEVIDLSDDFLFMTALSFVQSSSDIGLVLDFYFDSSKANGIARSFKWAHPKDGHTYVVKFRGPMTRNWEEDLIEGGYQSVRQISLKIIGKIAD